MVLTTLAFFVMIDQRKIYSTYGHVDKDGKLSIYNKHQFLNVLNDYFKSTSIELIISQKQSEFSDSMRNYYFAVVVKEVQKAYRATGVVKSLKDIDTELRSMYLYKEIYNENKGVWERENHTLKKGETEVSKKMMRDFIDMVIIWAITNLDWAIPYPSEQITKDDLTEHQKLVSRMGSNYKSTF